MRGSRRDEIHPEKAGQLTLACLGIDGDRLCAIIDERLAVEEAEFDAAPEFALA
ncbi:MAG: hypothetical protein VYB05_12040 [Pseudomonadota bacterium]|nr:hypothetical protein [Pseudomonadota bacterium]